MTETGDPIPDGLRLFRVIAEHYRTVLTSDMSEQKTEHWLRSHLVFGHAEVYDERLAFEGQELRQRHIDYAMSRGKVELFIDADSDNCAYALSKNIPSILFATPKFLRTKRPVKQWDDLKTEVERQRAALLDKHIGSRVNKFE
jgi:hypothetical protein